MAKPITQKAKSSPFKQTGPGDIVMRSEKVTKGTEGTAGTTTTTSEGYEYTGTNRNSDIYKILGKEISSGFARRKYGYEGNDPKEYEQLKLKRRHDRGDANIKAGKTTTVTTPGTPGTPDKVEVKDKPVYTKDKYDAITPYQQYQNKLTANRSVRFNENLDKKQQNKLAKEFASNYGSGNDGIFQNWKQRRDFKKGRISNDDIVKTFDDLNTKMGGATGTGAEKLAEYQSNYAGSRGLKADQQSYNVDEGVQASRRQYSTNSSKDDVYYSDPRVANQTDAGDPIVTAQTSTMDGKATFTDGNENPEAPGKMMGRHSQNVGIKQRTPLKKGYFK